MKNFFLSACLLLFGATAPLGADAILPSAATDWLEALPKSEYDLEALAPTLTTPAEAFAYVRDRIAYEPYSGVMKGAAGALSTRGGNDWDRALVLAHLLAAQGLDVSLVRGELAPAQVAAIVSRIRKSPTADKLQSQPQTGAKSSVEISPAADQARTAFNVRKTARRTALIADFGAAEMLLKTPRAEIHVPVQALQVPASHVWVQATIDGKTVSLDPSMADAKLGAAPAEVVDSWAVDALPPQVYQRIRVRLVEEQLDKTGHLENRALLSQEQNAIDGVLKNFRFAILPQLEASAAGDFRPVLIVGDNTIEGTAFRLEGEAQAPVESGGGGLLGGFGAVDTEPTPAPKPATAEMSRLGRLYLEFTTLVPGMPDETSRRMIVDRLTPAESDRWKLVDALADDRQVRPLLAQVWDLTCDVGAPHPAAFFQAQRDALNSLDPIASALSSGKLDPSALPSPVVVASAVGFEIASAAAQQTASFALGKRFHLRPRLIAWRHGFAIRDWRHPGGAPRYEEGIDLLNVPFVFDSEQPEQSAFRSGIIDTILENYSQSAPRPLNTLPLLTAAKQQSIKLLVLAPGDEAKISQLAYAEPQREALRQELREGRSLVLPSQPVTLNGTPFLGWWSVDPKSGYTIGKMDLGGAQGLTEASEINQKITQWTEAYVKFLGNVLKCYKGALQDALGSASVDYQNVSVNVSLNHGDNPMPGTDALIGCLRGAACDALKDFVEGELNDAALYDEANDVEEMIAKWAESKARSTAVDDTGKACEALLSGGS